ncbi:MAG TPA: hypothetical protein VGL21_06670 [Jatrophihabitantaceae bacterium]
MALPGRREARTSPRRRVGRLDDNNVVKTVAVGNKPFASGEEMC